MDFAALREINPDIVAWIYIEGTKINYPIVQGEDNSYYLKHLFSGEWNGSGCIFLDFRNDASFADRHSIIYGHHMKNGTMFTDLDKYKKQEFFDEHPVALLLTPDKNYKVDFFAGYVAAPQDDAWEIGFTEAKFEVWLQNAADRSCFTSEIAPIASDRILTLSTCSYELMMPVLCWQECFDEKPLARVSYNSNRSDKMFHLHPEPISCTRHVAHYSGKSTPRTKEYVHKEL